MSDTSYSTIIKAAEALKSWPVAEAFFLIVVAFLGIYFRQVGSKETKSGSHQGNYDMPFYMMIHDAARDVTTIKVLLERLNRGQEYTHRILEEGLRDREFDLLREREKRNNAPEGEG